MYLIGYDIGSSSIKAALIEADSQEVIQVVQSPKVEMDMISHHPGWAEQDPEVWYEHVCHATREILESASIDPSQIKGIGISYQMHGLVVVDEDHQVLRPSIIWCDSRAVKIGQDALEAIGGERCLARTMNFPGNFTASKLAWVKENEPEIYARIHKIMLPGDYIAMRLTGEITTTISGLSEGIFWDFESSDLSEDILSHYGFCQELIADIRPTFSDQGKVSEESAAETGLSVGIPVTYRAGDQPNNALSLGVLNPGEVAATGGTSGVVYGVIDTNAYDPRSRVNNFAHVNHTASDPRIGVLLCINGSGIEYSFTRQIMAEDGVSYDDMEQEAQMVDIGSDGLVILPFGNGAERMLENVNVGAQFLHVEFNRHKRAHFYRASLEGIAFSFVYGIEIMREMGLQVNEIKAGNDNLFQSQIFSDTISHLTNAQVHIVKTTGAVGAAKAAGVATGIYASVEDACQSGDPIKTYKPTGDKIPYQAAYDRWKAELLKQL